MFSEYCSIKTTIDISLLSVIGRKRLKFDGNNRNRNVVVTKVEYMEEIGGLSTKITRYYDYNTQSWVYLASQVSVNNGWLEENYAPLSLPTYTCRVLGPVK